MDGWTELLSTNIGLFVLLVCVSCLFYSLFPSFSFLCRNTAFNAYLIMGATGVIPLMMLKGRDVSNLRWCCRYMIPAKWIFGITVDVRRAENMIQDRPCVIVSNHQSNLDLFGMAELFPPRATYLVKREFLYYGPLGLCFWLSGAVFVNRKSREDGQRALQKIVREIKTRNLKVWIYPEGTRNQGPGMLPFKKGAFNLAVEAQVPIVPVVFKSQSEFYNPKKNIFKTGTYVVEVLPPIETEGLVMDDVNRLCDDTRDIMLNAFNRLAES